MPVTEAIVRDGRIINRAPSPEDYDDGAWDIGVCWVSPEPEDEERIIRMHAAVRTGANYVQVLHNVVSGGHMYHLKSKKIDISAL